jgi:hypothetical protein
MLLNRCNEMENTGISMGMGGCCNSGCTCSPVMECPQERVCHREMNYEVPHIIPVNTRIINHHVYRHTYQPMYTCTMEDTVSNVYDNRCGF